MSKTRISRRDFLKMASATSAGLALSACGVDATKLRDSTAISSETPLPTITSTPEWTKPPTLTPTATPIPTTTITLKAILDVDNSAIDDGPCYVVRPPQDDPATTLYKYFSPVASLREWEAALIAQKPTLEGFVIQDTVSGISGITNREGIVNLSIFSSQKQLNLTIKQPDIDSTMRMTYINKFTEPVAIPEYTINGKKITQQKLSKTIQTKIYGSSIIQQLDIVPNENLYKVFFSQGTISSPFSFDDWHSNVISATGFDFDPERQRVLSYYGSTKIAQSTAGAKGTANAHHGTDIWAKRGTIIRAPADGMLSYTKVQTGEGSSLNAVLTCTYDSLDLILGHLSEFLAVPPSYYDKTLQVDDFIKLPSFFVYRGQILGAVGRSGTNENHLHIDCGNTIRTFPVPPDDPFYGKSGGMPSDNRYYIPLEAWVGSTRAPKGYWDTTKNQHAVFNLWSGRV